MVKMVELPINILYMILGLPICFLGYKYLKPAVLVVGTVGGYVLLMMLLTIFWSWWTASDAIQLCVVLGSFLAGIGLGVALWFLPKFGQAVTGFVTGAVLGMQVYGVTSALKGSVGPTWLLPILVVVCATGGVFLGSFLRTYFFMTTTAYLGAFLVVRGVGNLLGNYPNVLTLDEGVVIENVYYLYVGVIVCVALAGYFTQVMMKAKWPSTDDGADMCGTLTVGLNAEVGGNAPPQEGGAEVEIVEVVEVVEGDENAEVVVEVEVQAEGEEAPVEAEAEAE